MKGKVKVISVVSLCLFAVLLVAGCAQKPTASNSSEAIKAASAMDTVKQKVDYLVKEGQAFYNSKDFQNAVDIAQYVLQNLDKDSAAAKSLMEKAKQELTKMVESAAGEAKKKLLDMGK